MESCSMSKHEVPPGLATLGFATREGAASSESPTHAKISRKRRGRIDELVETALEFAKTETSLTAKKPSKAVEEVVEVAVEGAVEEFAAGAGAGGAAGAGAAGAGGALTIRGMPTPLWQLSLQYLGMDLHCWCRMQLVCQAWFQSSRTPIWTSTVFVQSSPGSLFGNRDCQLMSAALTALRTLDLSECNAITDQGVRSLVCLTALQTLHLSRTDITDQGLQSLSCLTALKTLGLYNCPGITDQGLQPLTCLTALQYLDLSHSAAFQSLQSLPYLTALQVLDLSHCDAITDQGVRSVSFLTALQELNLQGCTDITDQGVLSLSTLTSLHSLDISFCKKITGQGMRSLSCLTALQTLNLSNCNVIDQYLLSLTTLIALRTLDLSYCPFITNQGVRWSLSCRWSLQVLRVTCCMRCGRELMRNFPESKLRVLDLIPCARRIFYQFYHFSCPICPMRRVLLDPHRNSEYWT